MTARSPVHPGELLLSLGLIALGSFVVFETGGIAESQGYAQIGPRLFPYLIGAGLTLCGAVLGWQALSGGWRNVPLDQEGHDAPDWMAFGIISAGIVLHMVDHRLGRIHHRLHAAVRADRARLRQPAARARRGHRRRCWPSSCSSSSRWAWASTCPRVRSAAR